MKAYRSISMQIMLAVLLTVISALAISSLVELKILRQRETRTLQETGRLTADRVANSLAYPLWNLNHEETEHVVLDEIGSTDIFRIQVFDEDGSLYVGKVRGSDGTVKDIADTDRSALNTPNTTLYPFSREINFRNTRIGSVTLEVTDASLQAELTSQRREIALKLGLLIAVLSVVLLLMLRVLVIRPISTLKSWVANITSANVSQPPRFKLSDEINSLAQAFADMSVKLREKNAELESEQQRLRALNSQMQREIEDRKLAERALTESETRFRTIFENSGSSIALVDMEGHPVKSNPALQLLLGYTEEELCNMPFTEFTHVDDRELDWGLYRELVAGKRDKYEIEKRFITKDGRVIWGNLIVSLVKDKEKVPKYAVGMVQDITERKDAEDELRQVSERLKLATRAAGIGIWDWDVVKDELIWDDKMYDLFGVRHEDFSGAFDAWARTLVPEDFERANARVQAALRSEQEYDPEFRIVWPDGSIHFIKAAALTFYDEGGNPVRMVGVNYDITGRKLAEEKLRLSEERLLLILDSAAEGIFGVDLEGRCTFCNAASLRLLGYDDPSELLGQDMHALIASRRADGTPFPMEECPAIQSLRRAASAFSDADVFWRKDGAYFPVAYWSHPMFRQGEHIGAVITFLDITERKLAEEQNRRLIHDLGERVKELTALHQTARILQDDEKDVPELLQRIVMLLPAAWQYPEVTAVHISFGEMEFTTRNFAPTRWSQAAEFTVDGLRGAIEVYYLEERPEEDIGPFMVEERNLINSLAELIRSALNRRVAQEALRASEERFARAFHASPEPISIYRHRDGTLQEVNDRWTTVYGYARGEAIGRTSMELKLVKPEVWQQLRRLLEEQGSVRDFEFDSRTKQGEIRQVSLAAEQIIINNETCDIFLHYDITERKKAEEELKASREQLRALSENLRKAKEEEGIRIARELHDELGAALTSLKWSLTRLDRIFSEAVNNGSQVTAREKIVEMVGLVDATINSVRRISSELRPGVLDDLGLISAIEWHAQQFQTNSGIVCRFDSLLENVDLSREQATTVFRIFQEAMTNILRHAEATKVNILIEEEEDEFVLEVSDNGRGITESEKLGTRSLGLLGMRERAHSIGGRIEVNGTAGKGTTIIVRLPLQTNQHNLSPCPTG